MTGVSVVVAIKERTRAAGREGGRKEENINYSLCTGQREIVNQRNTTRHVRQDTSISSR